MLRFLIGLLVFTIIGSVFVYQLIAKAYDDAYMYVVIPVEDTEIRIP